MGDLRSLDAVQHGAATSYVYGECDTRVSNAAMSGAAIGPIEP